MKPINRMYALLAGVVISSGAVLIAQSNYYANKSWLALTQIAEDTDKIHPTDHMQRTHAQAFGSPLEGVVLSMVGKDTDGLAHLSVSMNGKPWYEKDLSGQKEYMNGLLIYSEIPRAEFQITTRDVKGNMNKSRKVVLEITDNVAREDIPFEVGYIDAEVLSSQKADTKWTPKF